MAHQGTEGSQHAQRGAGGLSYLPGVDGGYEGGGTYTKHSLQPSIQDYENVFGPAARDIKDDPHRQKRVGRRHLPEILRGPNQFLTDRVDGLITDATNSPFTTKILPYKYVEQPDGKLQWNVWSFDEGMASRVPYESAARVLTQSNRSFAGYMVRQGMAIVLEHNFMMKPEGRENFRNQLMQLVGSIQYTNDLDVHIALVQAPSYEKHMREKYYADDKTPMQVCREYVDLFGFMQKNNNALDILIEESKARLKSWGGPMPDFLLCNSKLTFQLTMTPEKTNWVTNGYDGQKRLKTGPDIPSYRGVNIIHSRSFSMEGGAPPRDILRRKVRVAEYYRIYPHKDNHKRDFMFYNEERDTWFSYSFQELVRMAATTNALKPDDDPANNQLKLRNAIGISNGDVGDEGGDDGEHGDSVHVSDRIGSRRDTRQVTKQQYINPQQRLSLADGAEDVHLGLSLEGNTFSKAEVIKQCALMATTDGFFAPNGTFVTSDCFFAFGAVSWQKFYVKYNGPVNSDRTTGTEMYIPPDKYYFGKAVDGDIDCLMNGDGYGSNEHLEMRKFLSANAKTRIEFRYTAALVNATNLDSVIRNRILFALLLEGICDYPRLIGDFVTADGSTSELSKSFISAAQDKKYSTCLRFRNWMRYGVSTKLLADDTSIQIMKKKQAGSKFFDKKQAPSVFNVKGQFVGSTNGYNETCFDRPGDDGLVFLRDAGAFLAPNHFQRDNEGNYDTFALWCGANIILPKELIDLLLKYKGTLIPTDRRKLIHPGCLLLDCFSSDNDFIQKFKQGINRLLNQAKSSLAGISTVSRIDLTCYIKDVITNIIEMLQVGDYKYDNPLKDFIWTWPDERYFDNTPSSIDEVWCHGKTDARVFGINDIAGNFPSFQVGLGAITHWGSNFKNAIADSSSTVPARYNASIARGLVAMNEVDNDVKNSFVSSWKFSTSVTVIDLASETGTADEFLSQLLCRFMFDQSEPLLQTKEELRKMLQLGVPTGPISKRKKYEPLNDSLGGIYVSSLRYLDKQTINDASYLGVRENVSISDLREGRQANKESDVSALKAFTETPHNKRLDNIEIVIIRPNIEHQMLGIIMGQGGEGLGHTLWGQTELSCYDDSMHGIWGMSYKYHERAIVFNEKNLVRLWDVAYDGYTGGKDASYVDWNNTDAFNTLTQDIASNYRGPSMMVMGFCHDLKDPRKQPARNWPSPIVFHDNYDYSDDPDRRNAQSRPIQDGNYSLVADPCNSRIVNFKDMRVFNNEMYKAYEFYRQKMPDFTALHESRKPAGISVVENETFCDALAFQGTMRVIDRSSGHEVEHIQGSGHHGPDWVGVASVRAGKGYKALSGAPSLSRLV